MQRRRETQLLKNHGEHITYADKTKEADVKAKVNDATIHDEDGKCLDLIYDAIWSWVGMRRTCCSNGIEDAVNYDTEEIKMTGEGTNKRKVKVKISIHL